MLEILENKFPLESHICMGYDAVTDTQKSRNQTDTNYQRGYLFNMSTLQNVQLQQSGINNTEDTKD
jgi:hypothetical protein